MKPITNRHVMWFDYLVSRCEAGSPPSSGSMDMVIMKGLLSRGYAESDGVFFRPTAIGKIAIESFKRKGVQK